MSSGKRGRPKNEEVHRIIDTIREKYPMFSQVQMSMVRHPEYGVQLSSGAISHLRDKGISLPADLVPRRVKKIENRNKSKKVTFRLNNTQKVRLIEQAKESDCKSVQEYIEKLIERGL